MSLSRGCTLSRSPGACPQSSCDLGADSVDRAPWNRVSDLSGSAPHWLVKNTANASAPKVRLSIGGPPLVGRSANHGMDCTSRAAILNLSVDETHRSRPRTRLESDGLDTLVRRRLFQPYTYVHRPRARTACDRCVAGGLRGPRMTGLPVSCYRRSAISLPVHHVWAMSPSPRDPCAGPGLPCEWVGGGRGSP